MPTSSPALPLTSMMLTSWVPAAGSDFRIQAGPGHHARTKTGHFLLRGKADPPSCGGRGCHDAEEAEDKGANPHCVDHVIWPGEEVPARGLVLLQLTPITSKDLLA